jgi:CHAT domain-containing protein
MQSGLLLSDGNQLPDLAGGSDYVLPARDLMLRGAIAEHLTVQACSLGRTMVADSDELWGFSRAALAGGARSVLAPLWDINLASSTALLEAFYRHWLHESMDKHRAWSAAQFEMYRGDHGEGWRHPYHWAAFTMAGV